MMATNACLVWLFSPIRTHRYCTMVGTLMSGEAAAARAFINASACVVSESCNYLLAQCSCIVLSRILLSWSQRQRRVIQRDVLFQHEYKK